jgi:serine protease Do
MPRRTPTIFYAALIAVTSLVVGMVIASRLDLAPASFAGTATVPEANSAPLDGPLDASTFRNIAASTGPAVVSIVTEVTRERQRNPLRELLPGFGEQFEDPEPEVAQGAGSGFIVDDDGYILTNRHVIEGATRIEIYTADMDTTLNLPGLQAEVVGQDRLTDTALLRLTERPRQPLTEIKFGDSDQLAPGDWVMAIGNPFQFANTVTVGVVSARGRETALAVPGRSEALIQTDAAINRGNSGGPLLNIRGEVVGINTMIVSNSPTGMNVGIGFAVPINTVRDVLPGLRDGKVVRGVIGVSVDPIPISQEEAEDLGLPRAAGVRITQVPAGPARDAGIRIHDVVVEYNGEAVNRSQELVDKVVRTRPGTSVPVKLYRDGRAVTVSVTVGELDLDAEVARSVPERAPRDRDEPVEAGFGLEIGALTPTLARQLRVPANRGGAVITNVTPRSAAARAGLGRGDVILSIGGRDVANLDEVGDALDSVQTGRTVRLTVWRQGDEVGILLRTR